MVLLLWLLLLFLVVINVGVVVDVVVVVVVGGALFTAPIAATTDCRGWVDECSSAVDYNAAAAMCR